MVAPAFKGVFITRYEAIRDFVVATIFYMLIVFSRELYALIKGVAVDDLFEHSKSHIPVLVYGSIIYFGFLIFWSISVYKSIRHHRKKQRDLKILLEEQQEYKENAGLENDIYFD